MSNEQKTMEKRKGGFWRSYSFVLTLILLISLSCVSAFATKYAILDGRIYKSGPLSSSGWQLMSFDTSKPSDVSESQLASWWNTFGTETGLISSGSGGLTQAELNDSLEKYVGKRVSSYLFPGADGVNVSVTVSDLYDAISQNAIYSTMPLYDTRASAPTLGADGKVSNTGSMSVAYLLRNGFAGLARDLVEDGSSQTYYKISDTNPNGSITSTTVRSLSSRLGLGLSVLSQNQVKLYALEQSIYELEQEIKSVNEFWYDTLNRSLVGSGSASVTFWNSSDQSEEAETYSDILSAVTALGSSMQNDLAKLRYVLASDQDIEMQERLEPVRGEVEDQFTGDSSAAVKPDQIGDMAGISGDFQGAFNTGANASDAIGAISNSENWNFWSQEVQSDLNRVPVTASDELEDNFIHFYDPSVLDAYLSGGDGA